MDAEFCEISALSCEKGFRAILDGAAWHFEGTPDESAAFTEKLAARDDHADRGMVTFLDHHEFWNGATLFCHTDSLSYWRKRKGFPHVPASVHPGGWQELAGLIRAYFRQIEGRGEKLCCGGFSPWRTGLFLRVPRGLFAKAPGMGRW
jgi:hypothetical protein